MLTYLLFLFLLYLLYSFAGSRALALALKLVSVGIERRNCDLCFPTKTRNTKTIRQLTCSNRESWQWRQKENKKYEIEGKADKQQQPTHKSCIYTDTYADTHMHSDHLHFTCSVYFGAQLVARPTLRKNNSR